MKANNQSDKKSNMNFALINFLSNPDNWNLTRNETAGKTLNLTESASFSEIKNHSKMLISDNKHQLIVTITLWGIATLSACIITWEQQGALPIEAKEVILLLVPILLIGSAIGAAFLSYKTFNKTQLKKIKSIKATQQNMKNFFTERGLKEEDYKDKSVLQTIRDNPIKASVQM